jgi:hypothetical protein
MEGMFGDGADFRIGRRRGKVGAEDADAGAAETVGVQKAGIVDGLVRVECRNWVGRIRACDDGEDGCCVGDGSSDRAAHVVVCKERDDAGTAGKADGGADADKVVMGGWAADGVTGVRAEAAFPEVCGDRCGGAAAGASGDAGEVVGVAGDTGDGAFGDVGAEGPLGHVGFGEKDGAGGAEFTDHGGVGCGDEAFHGKRATGGL